MKLKRRLIVVFVIVSIFLLSYNSVLAANMSDFIKGVEYTEEFKEYLKLSEEERKNVVQPPIFEILETKAETKNPFNLLRMVGSSINARYTLKDVIPNNMIIKNQWKTNDCWAFASLSSLETYLALNNTDTSKVYDFSERHMNYSMVRAFANDEINENGLNRKPLDGGTWEIATAYLTSGLGPIEESDMPNQKTSEVIDISEIQNKEVTGQVYDTISFPTYTGTEDTTSLRQQMKEHIMNYGSIGACIHGAQPVLKTTCYNNSTGALYCSDPETCTIDHAVSIVGWDDNYDINNFNEGNRPQNNGAWIIRNSWGEKIELTLEEMKEELFNSNKAYCIENGWESAEDIPADTVKTIFENNGYTIEDDTAIMNVGDNGFMYISYEDINIYKSLFGITNSSDSVDYDNIYQYNNYGVNGKITIGNSKIYLGNIFNKQTSETEYLTQVSLYTPESCTCKVYVNVNGTSMEKANLQQISLKAGDTETIGAGYHTLEFLEPLEIQNSSFSVVIEMQGTREDEISFGVENNISDSVYDVVQVEEGKCFLSFGDFFESNQWLDMSQLDQIGAVNSDSTIKAFTVNEIVDNSLRDIQITNPPDKTAYFIGENFDDSGMQVTANYNNGESKVITDYNITNGTNLQKDQTSVTISYGDKTVTQPITVEENVVTSIRIKEAPTKLNYKAGEDFDKTGMVVEAVYKDGTTVEITDYTIEDGTNLKNGQTSVTISFEGKSVVQAITIESNALQSIVVKKAPDKINYVAGQDFDKTGMVVEAIYEDGTTIEITDYTIENGSNLTKDQTSVTIKFEDKTTTQNISVEEKTIVSISISKLPDKTTYIQNKEDLDLTGGSIVVVYNDGEEEEILMNSNQVEAIGFSNEKAGKVTITLVYQSKTVEFDVEIEEEVIQEEDAVNSDLTNAKCNVEKVQSYAFTDGTDNNYAIVEILVDGIIRNLNNDSYEYYYYLSPNQFEEEIDGWIQIKEVQSDNDKIKFKIDTRDIKNIEEISKSNVLYLYIKEVVTKGGNKSVAISNSMLVESNIKVEEYVDYKPYQNSNDSTDTTIATGTIPQAGTSVIVLVSIIIIAVVTIGLYIKYRKLNKYLK